MTLAPAVLALGLLAPPSGTLYGTVKGVRRCGPTQLDTRRTDCDFDLGSLHFSIQAVSQRSGGFTVFKAEWDSDYHLQYGRHTGGGATVVPLPLRPPRPY